MFSEIIKDLNCLNMWLPQLWWKLVCSLYLKLLQFLHRMDVAHIVNSVSAVTATSMDDTILRLWDCVSSGLSSKLIV